MTAQLMALFAFGLVMTGVVYLGVLRAREIAERVARVEAVESRREDSLRRGEFGRHSSRKAS